MKCADVLICTKPVLLMKTQYWLPFIRFIMKYQYHLASSRASVNRPPRPPLTECVSLQTLWDPVALIGLEIAADGYEKLTGWSFLTDASHSSGQATRSWAGGGLDDGRGVCAILQGYITHLRVVTSLRPSYCTHMHPLTLRWVGTGGTQTCKSTRPACVYAQRARALREHSPVRAGTL